MLLEIIDLLRCTASHEESPLVATIHARDDREIITGLLGCPVCAVEYRIEGGVALFGPRATSEAPEAGDAQPDADDRRTLRLAATLGLADPGGTAVLAPSFAQVAHALGPMARVAILLVNPPAGVSLGNGTAGIRVGDALPLATASVRGIALDASTATPRMIASAVRALRPGGRLVAPEFVPVPRGVTELARDERIWVAEAEPSVGAPVQLRRGASR